MVDKDRISATKTPKSYYAHCGSYGCMLLPAPLKSALLHQLIRYLSRMHFYAAGGATQHETILPSKTNLSPAQERLENAADAVNRMQEAKEVQKSAADNSCFGHGLGIISPEAAPAPGTS
jgi:hypothetical protein